MGVRQRQAESNKMLNTVVFISLTLISLTQATCILTESKDNMVAARLEGNWTFNGPLSNHLSKGGATKAPVGEIIVSFSNDSSVLENIPEDNCSFLQANGLNIYLAGTLQFVHFELGAQSHPFVLTSIDGVSALIYWQGINAVTNLVQVAPAMIHQHDLLFLGDNSAEEPFGVMERIGTQGTLCQ